MTTELSLKQEIADLVKKRLTWALIVSEGNQKEAARLLGLTYRQFRHLLEKHHLAPRQQWLRSIKAARQRSQREVQ